MKPERSSIRSVRIKKGIICAIFAAAVLASCTLVPERYDTELGAAFVAVSMGADGLQRVCGNAQAETVAQANLLRLATYEERYARFYGNESDQAAGAALLKAVGDFVPGIGITYCTEHALNIKTRVAREAKVLRERPRR